MRKICLRCGSKFGNRAEFCPHDGTRLATDQDVPDPMIGTVLLEQFRIDALVGTGGMGTVYRARQTTVGRDVAVKVLRLELARDESAVLRFEREARLATSLDHPNLVRVFLSGRLSDGRIYIVMELLEGRSLADELDERGIPKIERSLVMIMKLCAGLCAVHDKGIVHRDIKPENIYLVQRGTDEDFVKLVDFGISRALDTETVSTDSSSGRVFGTAAYISPEAATGDPTDRRSDIYSIGVLTYQLLTGELPFEGKTAGAMLMQHVHEDPPPLYTKGSGDKVPRGIAEVVMLALAKDPAVRYQTLAEFVDDLAEAAVDAGLLTDARALLLGTVWGDELAAPGSFLADLLGGSSPPGTADTFEMPIDRDTNEDALLSSAPRPFGTSSLEMPKVQRPRPRSRRWLWASVGALAFVLGGAVVGTLWLKRETRAIAADHPLAPSRPSDSDEPSRRMSVADVGTGEPVVVELVTPEDAPDPVVETEPELEKPPEKSRKRRQRRRVQATGAAPKAATAAKPAAQTESAAKWQDDGIDWSLPAFPLEDDASDGGTPESREQSDPTTPTGTPDVPARNPVVIDEVPGDGSP